MSLAMKMSLVTLLKQRKFAKTNLNKHLLCKSFSNIDGDFPKTHDNPISQSKSYDKINSVDKATTGSSAPAHPPKIDTNHTPEHDTAESHPHKASDSLHNSKSETKPHVAGGLNATLHYTQEKLHFANQFAAKSYEDLERNLMQTLHEKSQARFRVYFSATVLFILWIVSMFGNRIRKSFTQHTAGLAKETLENESLQIQTQELAMAVVQTVLNDKEVTAHAASFLKEASSAPETQQAILKLTLHILQHEESLAELTQLAKRLIANLSSDQETVAKLVELFSAVLAEPALKAALVSLLSDLCKEPAVVQAVTEMALAVIARDAIYNATTDLLVKSSTALLADEEVQEQSRSFVAEVVGDDALQREGGDALLNTVTHALKPGIIRITGAGLVMVSLAVIRVLLSPY